MNGDKSLIQSDCNYIRNNDFTRISQKIYSLIGQHVHSLPCNITLQLAGAYLTDIIEKFQLVLVRPGSSKDTHTGYDDARPVDTEADGVWRAVSRVPRAALVCAVET